jgi:hypothetical protein
VALIAGTLSCSAVRRKGLLRGESDHISDNALGHHRVQRHRIGDGQDPRGARGWFRSKGYSAAVLTACHQGAMSIIGSSTAVEASVPHADMAQAIALLSLWSGISGSIGAAVSAAIWTDQLPKNLEKYLGATLDNATIAEAYGSIVIARTTEPRDKIIQGVLSCFLSRSSFF